ncbi:hypothetical protein ZIOFF_016504 [Zingiber officinale]|uniref:beta-galactosidase n=1 Tax=Zingiber officinale TaxID=94328 RepID=A0A8J5LVD2_ZINOF|nr:hypothetical protein ZIOFF_016504 [Zingiber officinale]
MQIEGDHDVRSSMPEADLLPAKSARRQDAAEDASCRAYVDQLHLPPISELGVAWPSTAAPSESEQIRRCCIWTSGTVLKMIIQSGITKALQDASLRLPITDDVKVDIRELEEVMNVTLLELVSLSPCTGRFQPKMWDGLLKKAKDGGLDVIQTHVFWNGHQPSLGNYNFKGRYDWVRFIKTVQKVGLYISVLNGILVWLKYVPRISFRTDNEPFKIENEYGPESKAFGIVGHAYLNWAAQMALGLGTGH